MESEDSQKLLITIFFSKNTRSRPYQLLKYRITNDPDKLPVESIIIKKKKNYSKSTAEKAGGLLDVLKISIGCRVMLRRNIDKRRGLVNGAIGILENIKKEQNEIVSELHVRFDSAPNEILIIERVTATFTYGLDTKMQRRQFPIRPCYAITYHKCQGVSCDNAVCDLSSAFCSHMGYALNIFHLKSHLGMWL